MEEESDCEVLVELFKESACTSITETVTCQQSEPEESLESDDITILPCVSGTSHEVVVETSLKSKVIRPKMAKIQPNFFFAIQVKHFQIRNQALMVQNHVTGIDKRLSKAVIKPDSFHVTLCVVHLKNQKEIDIARDALINVLTDFSNDFVSNPLCLQFQGVGTFRGQVVYAKLVDETSVIERLKPVIQKLHFEIGKNGILVTDKREWKPHLTLMKLSKNPKLMRKVKRINPSLLSDFKDTDFGYEAVESIQLCSMNGPKDADGYYSKVAEFCFAESVPQPQPVLQPSTVIQQRLNTLAAATSAIKRKIHSLVPVRDEKKAKVEDKTPSRSLKYVAAAGAIALGALVAVKTLKRGS